MLNFRTEEYTAMNPFQRVPVVQDGGFALTESVAIFRKMFIISTENFPINIL